MSNTLQYDPLLVRDLAAELHARYAGAGLKRLALERDSRTLKLGFSRTALEWELHPARGYLRSTGSPLADGIRLGRRTIIERVHAPADDRLLIWEVRSDSSAGAGRLRQIVVELMTNQWNALALDREGRILSVLWRRSAGARRLEPGAHYALPPGNARHGAGSLLSHVTWSELLSGQAEEPRTTLLRKVAFTSPLNAAYILGEGSGPDEFPDAAYARYLSLLAPPEPCLLGTGGAQPYGHAIDDSAVMTETLLDAFAQAAQLDAGTSSSLGRAEQSLLKLQKKLERLERDLEEAPAEAAALRSQADVLLSNLSSIQRGAAHADVTDFDGKPLRIALNSKLSPAENAAQLYDQARRRQRALQSLPPLIEAARAEVAAAQGRVDRLLAGDATPEDHEIRRAPTVRRAADGPSLPYRVFRSSGGLEVRVGRNSRSNDALTFHHSRPNDIWLHARDASGAHVILRWADPEANPPARDLHEAAGLAALHSRARTSATVPVDWTRRKYVRKPRKAPPGTVVPERVKTVFVDPDIALEKRMREEPNA